MAYDLPGTYVDSVVNYAFFSSLKRVLFSKYSTVYDGLKYILTIITFHIILFEVRSWVKKNEFMERFSVTFCPYFLFFGTLRSCRFLPSAIYFFVPV